MSTTNTQQQNPNELIADDDFLAELENELNADGSEGIEVPEFEEVAGDEVAAADVETAKDKQPEKKAASKKGASKKKDASKKEAASDDGATTDETAAPKRQSLSGLPPSVAVHTALGDRMYKLCAMTPKQQAMKGEDRATAINEHFTNEIDTLAKKVKEKAVNVFQSIGGQASLSCFTQIAIDMLKDKGEFTATDLKARYLARPYTPGTAGAQSSQMMKLLPAIGIATREGNRLVLNEDSPLMELLAE